MLICANYDDDDTNADNEYDADESDADVYVDQIDFVDLYFRQVGLVYGFIVLSYSGTANDRTSGSGSRS